MSAIYEVPDGNKDEHVYETANPGNSSGNGDVRGDNSNEIPKLFHHLALGLLILTAVLISADLSVSLYLLQTPKDEGIEQRHSQSTDGQRLTQCKVGCTAPNVTALIPGGMVKQSYKPREEIRGLTCAVGEELVGDSSLVCQEDGSWHGTASCIRHVECQLPNVRALIPVAMVKQSYKPRQKIRGLTCAAGEQLTGDSSLVCQGDGTWHGNASCQPLGTFGCKAPNVTALIPGGMVKQSYKPREEIRGLTCAVGEELVGDSSLVCQEDGSWHGTASCIRHGMVKQSYKPGEEIRGLTCAAGEELVGDSSLVCKGDGTWHGTASCKRRVECQLPNMEALIPVAMVKQSYKPHEKISGLTCAAGEQLTGDSSLVCQGDGTWRGSASCQPRGTYSCKDGWIEHGESCYLFVDDDKKNWKAAGQFCNARGGHLVEVNSRFENEWLQQELRNLNQGKGGIRNYLTAGNDIQTEDSWVWSHSGRTIEETYWGPGEPSHRHDGNTEDCLSFAQELDFAWNDFPCKMKARFICEYSIDCA